MQSIRVLTFKITDPNPKKEKALNRTLRIFRRAFNFHLHKIGEDPGIITNKNMPKPIGKPRVFIPI